MPRSTSDDEKSKKRASRKRASLSPRKRAPRMVAAKGTAAKKPKEVEEKIESQTTRKSPTPIAAKKASSKARRNQALVALTIFVIGIGSSAAIGFTDAGQIDVNKEIEERNERLRSGQFNESDTQRVIIPVQNTEANKLPDGGLIGFGIGGGPPAPAPEPATTTASSTASSTDSTASSTDDGASESPEDESNEVGGEDAEGDTSTESETTVSSEPIPGDNQATEEAPSSGP